MKRGSSAWCLLLVWLLFVPAPADAQGSQSVSVSPTLFEMSASPEQQWRSTVRVINSNPYDLTLSIEPANFRPQGESGQAQFISIDDSGLNNETLAEWIALESSTITIPAERTMEIPFTITVPADAPPGGHFAALLIETSAIGSGAERTQVRTSQVISALIFLRVAGDIVEDGMIREFRPERSVVETPEVTFALRFANRGNVHLQPQGNIKIYNMWGQERGVIPINRQTMFGNVLPESIRKFTFTWSGEWSWADLGRYEAVATLAYGDGERQFTSRSTYFWVVPWRVLGGIVLVLTFFVALIVWSVRLYVRRMLKLAGVTADLQSVKRQAARRPRVSVTAPLEAGMLDLRERLATSQGWQGRLRAIADVMQRYWLFILVLLAILCFVLAFIWYLSAALSNDRAYSVEIQQRDRSITLTSEELYYDEIRDASAAEVPTTRTDFPPIKLINQSGQPGQAAALRVWLEDRAYPISGLSTELASNETNTIIVYDPTFTEAALTLSQELGGALLSAYASTSTLETPLTVYVGSDITDRIPMDTAQ